MTNTTVYSSNSTSIPKIYLYLSLFLKLNKFIL